MCEYNLSTFCFLCLNTFDQNLKNVFEKDEENISLVNKIEFLISSDLLLLDQDNPESICPSCQNSLNSYYIFKQTCLENNRRLKYLIANSNSDKIDLSILPIISTSTNDPINKMETSEESLFTNETTENKDEYELPKHKHYSPKISIEELKQEIKEFLEQYMDPDEDDSIEEDVDDKDENLGDREDSSTCSSDAMDCHDVNTVTDNLEANKTESGTLNLLEITSKVLRYQCCYCEKSYQTKSSLSKHVKIHQTDSSNNCYICQTKSTLRRHNLTHPDIDRLECHTCKVKSPCSDIPKNNEIIQSEKIKT